LKHTDGAKATIKWQGYSKYLTPALASGEEYRQRLLLRLIRNFLRTVRAGPVHPAALPRIVRHAWNAT
jgi:hypothetical protein